MKGRIGTLAIVSAVVTVSLMAFPGPAGAVGQFGDVQGVPFDLPQFGLADLVGPSPEVTGAPAIDLIGEEVLTCFERGGFGDVCRVNTVAGTLAGRSSSVPEVVAVAPLVSGLLAPAPEITELTRRTTGCFQGVCPLIDRVLAGFTSGGGLCAFCSDGASVGTTSAIRIGVLTSP